MQRVSDVIKPRDIYWVHAEDTVRQAVRYMCERKTGAIAVKKDDEVIGVFSERDLMHRVVSKGLDPDEVLVRDVMSTNLYKISLDDQIHSAKAKMYKHGVRHLLVVGRDGHYKGLASMRDLIEADMADSCELINRLNDAYYQQALSARWRISSNRVIIEKPTV